MKILFLSLVQIHSLDDQGIYTDLLRQLVKNGHFVRVISPSQSGATEDIVKDGYAILKVRSPQMRKVGFIRKGIASLRIGPIMRRALAKYCARERYNLVLVATPPITIAKTVGWVKRRDGAKVYLLLKDIWPQGIADLGGISQNGIIYRYYRFKERKLYALADRIGCMSPANVNYLLKHNPQIRSEIVEEFPNCEEIIELPAMESDKRYEVRRQYGLDIGATIFIVAGNLSAGHDFPFALDCFFELERRGRNIQLVFVGAGTQVKEIQKFIKERQSMNIHYVPMLPPQEYNELALACDVGLILLDHRFTIPNFPSRLLSYLRVRKPVFAITDNTTDIGRIVEENNFGWWCLDGDRESFFKCIERISSSDLIAMGETAFRFMRQNYDVEQNILKLLDIKW